jgi:hypothetical protein
MGFFGKILEKLGLKKDAPAVTAAAPAKPGCCKTDHRHLDRDRG